MNRLALFLVLVIGELVSGCDSYCSVDVATTRFLVVMRGYSKEDLHGMVLYRFSLPGQNLLDSSEVAIFDNRDSSFAVPAIEAAGSKYYRLRLSSGEEHVIGGFTFHQETCEGGLFQHSSSFSVLDSFVLDGERKEAGQMMEVTIRKK